MCRFSAALGLSAPNPHLVQGSSVYLYPVSSPFNLASSSLSQQADGNHNVGVDGTEIQRPGLPLTGCALKKKKKKIRKGEEGEG